MDNLFYTYAYLREDGTPYYIGKGKGNRAFEKCGRSVSPPPKERVLFLKKSLTEEEAFGHEKYMISVLGRKDLGTGILRNLTDGGEGVSGHVHSDCTRRKLSAARRRRVITEKTRQKLSEAGRGRKVSEETRRKISESNSGVNHRYFGKSLPDETKMKMSKARKGKVISEGARRKISEARVGMVFSEEHKEKISKAQRGLIWITNGEKSTRISPSDDIPEGWRRGRK